MNKQPDTSSITVRPQVDDRPFTIRALAAGFRPCSTDPTLGPTTYNCAECRVLGSAWGSAVRGYVHIVCGA